MAKTVQGILKIRKCVDISVRQSARSSVEEDTFERWKNAVDGGVSPGKSIGNPLYEHDKALFKNRVSSTSSSTGRGRGRGRGRGGRGRDRRGDVGRGFREGEGRGLAVR